MFNLKQRIAFSLILLGWGFFCKFSFAQDSAYEHVFKSIPNAAIIQLTGNFTIVGQTPLYVNHDLNGMYLIKVTKPGYESWKKQVMFHSGVKREFKFRLRPKTRWKAGWRSLLIPGWGQFYSGRRIKGSFVISTFGIAFGVTLATMFSYQHKADACKQTLAGMNDFRISNEEHQRLWQRALEQNREADKAYNLQQKWSWITTSLYVANLVDALILFPAFHSHGIGGDNVSITMRHRPGVTQIFTAFNF